MLAALLPGCGTYFPPDRNVKEILSETDVVGRWKMTSNSLRLFTRDGFRSEPAHAYTITFNDDGTCKYQSACEFGGKRRYISASGAWKLQHDTTGDSNESAKNVIRLELSVDGGKAIQHFQFTRTEGSLVLWHNYGDPDQWEFIEYDHDLHRQSTGAG